MQTLDYTIESPQERNALVAQICADADEDSLTAAYLETMADYLLFAMSKEERKQKKILTDNRMVTVRKRETSFQGLADKFDNNEDSLYNLFYEDKNVLLSPKISITIKDLQEVPGLKSLRNAILDVEAQARIATGRKKYSLKQQVIEMRRDQYILKNSYYSPIASKSIPHDFFTAPLDEEYTMDFWKQEPSSTGPIDLFNPKHVFLLLKDYSRLKQDVWDNFTADSHYLMEDLDNVIEDALAEDFPWLYDLLIWKIDGLSNIKVQEELYLKYGKKYSTQYISALWHRRIPNIIANKAKENFIVWYYMNVEYGEWKRCSCCGEVKLAHSRFFSKNNTSKDGFYSICKKCRKKKRAKNKEKKV